MGTTLTGKLIADTYDALLKVTDNNVITGIKKRLTDGFGNDTPLLISTTDVQIDGNFLLPGTTSQYVRGDGSLASFPSYVSSVGLSMPIAFNVSNSPITSSGTISVTAAGTASQYIRGDGTLGDFGGGGGGGGASISYYLNGSVNQGTFAGTTYYEVNKTPILGAGTNFTRNSNGYIASFITDANDPALLKIPGGNWNLEFYFSASSGGGTPTFYTELYKYDGTNFTLITSSSTNPDSITGGTSTEAYFTTLAVPETVLTLTDRLAIRIYVNTSGRTITLHTEDNNLCQIITTFTTGLTALNNLTEQVQFFGTGTSGSDFNISSSVNTHTFNIPTASSSARGLLSSTDWTTFNNKLSTVTRSNVISALGTGGSPFEFLKSDGTVDTNSYVTFGRTLTINGVTYDLSADRSWTIAAGVTSFNTRTGAITLTSGDVTGALGYTPYNATNPNAYISLTSLSASFPLGYNNTTGVFTIAQASSSQGGFLSSTDWSTFNNKLSTAILALNGLTSVSQSLQTGTSGTDFAISSSGSVHTFNIPTASGSARGLLSSSDWTSFNSKVSSQWTTSGSNIFYNTGNVGIGVSSPSNILHADRSQNSDTAILVSNANTGGSATAQYFASNGTNQTQFFHTGTSYGTSGILEASQGGIFNTTSAGIGLAAAGASGIIRFATGGTTERMRITSGGNVGIGTTSPGARLDVLAASPSIFVSDNLGAVAEHGFQFNASGFGLRGGLTINYNTAELRHWAGISGNTYFQTFLTNGSERMRIAANGNVGIGTSSPGRRLQVVGEISSEFGQGTIITRGGGTTLEIHIRPNQANSAYITFTENAVADRWSIGTTAGDGNFYFRVPYPGSPVAAYISPSGNIFASADVLAFSDISVKTNIRPIENALDKVLNSRGVVYDRIDTEEKDNIGFIAQELEVNFPELVSENSDGTKSVKYQNAVAVLFEAIKEQQKQIDELKKLLS